jgi:predicted enzyme related to lactoylglutathione lyase
MTPTLGSLILYTAKTEEMVTFYQTHFGYRAHRKDGDRITEPRPPEGGVPLLLHPAAKGIRQGQATVKLVFACDTVENFCAKSAARGLSFGKIHRADGYVFANAKDPSGNSVSISGRFA